MMLKSKVPYALDRLTYDPASNTIRDDQTGTTLTEGAFESLLAGLDPGTSGIGQTTLLRATITGSEIRAFESGQRDQRHQNLAETLRRGAEASQINSPLDSSQRGNRSSNHGTPGGFAQSHSMDADDRGRAGQHAEGELGYFYVLAYGSHVGNPLMYTTRTLGRRLETVYKRLTPQQRYEAAQSAVHGLSVKAPELTRGVTLHSGRAQLNEADYHPDDWSELATAEGFYDEAKGQAVVLVDNIRLREGETLESATARVVLHERLGHAGLEALIKSNTEAEGRWYGLVDGLSKDTRTAAELNDIAQQPGYTHLAGDQRKVAEEWFARKVETLTDKELADLKPDTVLGQMWQWLKDLLSKLTGRNGQQAWTDRELREIMILSREALRRSN